MLAYRLVVNTIDEYCKLGENTTMESLKCFVVGVWGCIESTYLRQPTRANLVKQLVINEARGFLGMFASTDCMHYQCKNLSCCMARSVSR
jgi:hypothetical protein